MMMATTHQPSTKQDILYYLLKQDQGTAQELADHLQISPQAIRRHLHDLETEGLIQHQPVQEGMGRPQHVYQLTDTGREQISRLCGDRGSDSYGEFALSLLESLAETVGQDQVSSILRKQWERKALEYREQLGNGSLQDRVAKLVELRRAEGYMAEWHVVEAPQSQGPFTPQFVITEYNCAISHIAESFPSVCGHELEMFAVALQDCHVERTHWLVNGEHRCGYLIREKS